MKHGRDLDYRSMRVGGSFPVLVTIGATNDGRRRRGGGDGGSGRYCDCTEVVRPYLFHLRLLLLNISSGHFRLGNGRINVPKRRHLVRQCELSAIERSRETATCGRGHRRAGIAVTTTRSGAENAGFVAKPPCPLTVLAFGHVATTANADKQ